MKPALAFIGAGRVATALAIRLHETGYRIKGIAARRMESAEKLAHQTNSAAAALPPYPDADIIFVCVPDDALADVAEALREQSITGSVVHTSGVHSLDVFAGLHRIGSFHPVYPFREGTRLDGSEDMLIGIEANEDALRDTLTEIARAVGGRPAVLKSGEKARYHAAAAIASNYLVTLFDISLQLLTSAGVTEDDARHALVNLMQGNLDNLRHLQPARALTGPIARGDISTIEKHLQALADTPYAALYKELGFQTLCIAPDLPKAAQDTLRELLRHTKTEKDTNATLNLQWRAIRELLRHMKIEKDS